MNAADTLALCQTLMAKPSITPNDEGCQAIIADALTPLGFRAQHLRYGKVDNLWLTHSNDPDGALPAPLFLFLGHTDVVPAGDFAAWRTDPFTPTIQNERLYGRGAADMKSGVACMVAAAKRFVAANPNHAGTAALLFTSDEEGIATDGVRRVAADFIKANGINIDYCLVGEPTSTETVADTIKIGRRGSLTGDITFHGTARHVAYAAPDDNLIFAAARWLADMQQQSWGAANAYFDATQFQCSAFAANSGASNVLPDTLRAVFNFRYNPADTEERLKQHVETLLDKHGLRYTLAWRPASDPFFSAPNGTLITATQAAIADKCGARAIESTSGGTSDGRFIAPLGAEVVELGPVNTSIHQANEWVDVAAFDLLPDIYTDILARLLSGKHANDQA